jgi:hypothetical protein
MEAHSLPPEPLPPFHAVQALEASAPALLDVHATTAAAVAAMPLDLPAGAPVALAVGSRGIVNYAKVVRAVVEVIKERGARPFVMPAMGSHGGATAEAQRGVLAEYGITEEGVGAPVVSSMDTVPVGVTPSGIEVFMARDAWNAGRVLMINRVKQHTDFSGPHESGLQKMIAIGLGKLDGARRFHMAAMRMGFHAALLEMARVALASGKILGGVAILENDRHQTADVVGVTAAEMETQEAQLLERARALHPHLPFSSLDLLIVDELGKDISGAGMDTRVIGRSVHPELDGADAVRAFPGGIRIRRIYVRDLTPATEGNACGVGLADIVHANVGRKIDFHKTYTNAITSLAYIAGALPMSLPNDREALNLLLRNLGRPAPETLRAARIRNTLALDAFQCSPACARELAGSPRYRVGPAAPLEFDAAGDLATPAREMAGVA